MNLIKLISILMMFFPVLSFANSEFTPGKVSKIILHDWGRVLVYLDNGINTVENCEKKSGFVLDRGNQHFAEMYSSLLSEYHAGTKVGGWVNGCDSLHKAPVLSRLDLMPK
ncbi:hypothetical protein [Photobacterium salinisoli]|uniref:hypothetical protein n=1 Tax=Photobacterium salinisoli TaxID=1616783 RepID=UPI000EA2544B|nr:hypothetical protein [Photobacterium salinisoli]